MKKLLTQSLLFISLIVCLASCVGGNLGYRKVAGVNHEMKSLSTYLLDEKGNNLWYKCDIQFFKKEFSGLLVFKHQENNAIRIAMVTEVGMKVFDME